MVPSRARVLCLVAAFPVYATLAFADPVPQQGPQAVSPGAAKRALLSMACPTFSWAPGTATAAHELAVFTLGEPAVLSATPVLSVALPARAASWTPPASECLQPGTRYMWFVRENGPKGPGEWSTGLAFTVAGAAEPDAADAESTTETTGTRASATAASKKPGAEKPPNEKPLNPNEEILAALATVNTKLDALLDPVKKEFCIDLGADLEIGGEYGGSIDAEIKGRLGAEAFGNGGMLEVKAPNSFGFAAALKGTASPKFSFCHALGASANASMTPAQQRMAASLSKSTAASDSDLTTKLLALAEQLQMNETRVSAALDLLPAFSDGSDAFSALRAGGPLTKLADVLPMPENLRSILRDPKQVIATFKAQFALCGRNDLPDVVAGLVGEFCTLANKERFRQILDDVNDGVNTVKGAVTTLGTKIQDAIDKIAVLDCKLFCGER